MKVVGIIILYVALVVAAVKVGEFIVDRYDDAKPTTEQIMRSLSQ